MLGGGFGEGMGILFQAFLTVFAEGVGVFAGQHADFDGHVPESYRSPGFSSSSGNGLPFPPESLTLPAP